MALRDLAVVFKFILERRLIPPLVSVPLLLNNHLQSRIINLDNLPFAGNQARLRDLEARLNYRFVKIDICDFEG